MARLRPSGARVRFGAGGRRGPGPALSTTTEEWRLPLEDASAPAEVLPPGVGASTRPTPTPYYAANHSSLPPDAVAAALPDGASATARSTSARVPAARLAWAASTLLTLVAAPAAALPPGTQHAAPPTARPAAAPHSWTLDALRAGLPPGAGEYSSPARREQPSALHGWTQGGILDPVVEPIPPGAQTATRSTRLVGLPGVPYSYSAPALALISDALTPPGGQGTAAPPQGPPRLELRRQSDGGFLLSLAVPPAAEIPPGTALAPRPTRAPLVVAQHSAAPGDDGTVPPDTALPIGGGDAARPPARVQAPRAFAFYYIQEEELQPPGGQTAARPTQPGRATPPGSAGSPLPLLVVPPPAALPVGQGQGIAVAPTPAPAPRTFRGTAQLEPPPSPEPLPIGNPAATAGPPARGPYLVAGLASAPGDDGTAPPSGDPLPVGSLAAFDRPPRRPLPIRPSAFYYVVEDEPPPPGGTATAAPAGLPYRTPRTLSAGLPTPLLPVGLPAVLPPGRAWESRPAVMPHDRHTLQSGPPLEPAVVPLPPGRPVMGPAVRPPSPPPGDNPIAFLGLQPIPLFVRGPQWQWARTARTRWTFEDGAGTRRWMAMTGGTAWEYAPGTLRWAFTPGRQVWEF